tara:strand:+ start:5579 stop:5923 length:345 start_codon:yes stop_codon:yes gene_type:complete
MGKRKLIEAYEQAVGQREVLRQKNIELNALNQRLTSNMKMKNSMLDLQKESLIELRSDALDIKIGFYNQLMQQDLLKENSIGIELDAQRKEAQEQFKKMQQDKIIQSYEQDKSN